MTTLDDKINQRFPGLDQHSVDTDMAPGEDRVKAWSARRN